MISSLPGLSTDNRAIFVFKFVTKTQTTYISTEKTEIAGIDAETLRYGDQSSIVSFTPGVSQGGTIDYSSNVELSIVKTDNALGNGFFNAFYPNTTEVLQGAFVTTYITWLGVTSIDDLVPLFTGKVVDYMYDDSIRIIIERSLPFLNETLPLYKTQNVIDNDISYSDSLPEESLGTTIPLLYGEYVPYLLYTDVFGFKAKIPRSSVVPTVKMDLDSISHKIASHATFVDTDATNFRATIYEDAITQNLFADSIDVDTGLFNTIKNYDLSGASITFVKYSDKLFLVGNTNYIPTINGFNNSGISSFLGSDKTTGFISDLHLVKSNIFSLTYKKTNNTMKDYEFFNESGKATGGLSLKINGTNVDSANYISLNVKVFDERLQTNYNPTFSPTQRFETYDDDVTATYSLEQIVGVDMTDYSWEASLKDTKDGALSLLDFTFTLESTSVGIIDLIIHNIFIEVKNVFIGGDFDIYKKIVNISGKSGEEASQIPGQKTGLEVTVRRGDLLDTKSAGAISTLFSYSSGRIFSPIVGASGNIVSWIRSTHGAINEQIQKPMYIIESLLREEAFKLIDLTVVGTTFAAPYKYIAIDDLPYGDIDDYYLNSVLSVPGLNKEYLVLGYQEYPEYPGRKSLRIYRDTGDNLSGYVVSLYNINSNINTFSFDYLDTSSLLQSWKFRNSLDSQQSTLDIIKKLTYESFTFITETNAGLTIVDILDSSDVKGTFSSPMIRDGVADISLRLESLTNVFTDYQVNYDYDYASNKHLKVIKRGIGNEPSGTSTPCEDSYKLYGQKRTFTYSASWHYDDDTVAKFIDKLVEWHTYNHSIIRYVGDVNQHIQFEIGDKVLINYPDKIPQSMNNSTVFMIIGKDIQQFPVPKIIFMLINIQKDSSYVPDSWSTTDVNWGDMDVNWEDA